MSYRSHSSYLSHFAVSGPLRHFPTAGAGGGYAFTMA
jgi:hypothetical protein